RRTAFPGRRPTWDGLEKPSYKTVLQNNDKDRANRIMAAETIRIGIVGAGANTRLRHIPGFRDIA
ncbi:unnamed protein product, partial [marine sediment metagenome]